MDELDADWRGPWNATQMRWVETKQVEEAYMFAKGMKTITGNRIDHMLISTFV